MRFVIPAFAALMLAAAPLAAMAQTAAPTTPGTTAPGTTAPGTTTPGTLTTKPARADKLDKRFTAANTTHDGHLTLEQARSAKWTQVVKHFTEIDSGAKGYVTATDIRTAMAAQRAARAQQKATPAPIKS